LVQDPLLDLVDHNFLFLQLDLEYQVYLVIKEKEVFQVPMAHLDQVDQKVTVDHQVNQALKESRVTLEDLVDQD
jgi:hypothetical protein